MDIKKKPQYQITKEVTERQLRASGKVLGINIDKAARDLDVISQNHEALWKFPISRAGAASLYNPGGKVDRSLEISAGAIVGNYYAAQSAALQRNLAMPGVVPLSGRLWGCQHRSNSSFACVNAVRSGSDNCMLENLIRCQCYSPNFEMPLVAALKGRKEVDCCIYCGQAIDHISHYSALSDNLCPDCKDRLLNMLQMIFNEVEQGQAVELGTDNAFEA